ncbi:MAG: radical SAM protein [bacterium]|nr:radical SAM protein [bacterium]
MKVLLVYPEYPATFWSFKHALPFINKKAAFPPLGLLTVSSLLPDKWEKKLVDMNVTKLKDKDIEWADYVLISGMIVQKKSSAEVIHRVKALGKPIVAGGPLFTTGYREFPDVDCFVLNEGEITIPLFLKDLEQGSIKPVYTSEEKPDIVHTPLPDWSLIHFKDYASMAIQVSRGCPFNCDFCDIIIMNGRIPRVKTPEQVRSEFDSLYAAGWHGSLFIVDDNFIGNKIKITQILKEIASWMDEKKRPFTLFTEASINLADENEIMELMQRSNFNSVFVGIETPDEESLKACGKLHNTNKDLVEKVKILQRNGLQVQGGFIVGFDTDTHHTFENMIKFIQKSGIVTAMVGLLNAFPETQLYKKLQKTGRILKIPSGSNTDFTINFKPRMNKDVLIEGYKKVLHSIFSPKNYYKRIITHLKEYNKSAKETKLAFWMKIKVLFEAIWKLGVREKGKRYFWKMCLWTIFRKPYLMAEAISLAIYGFHYRKVLIYV